MTMAGTARISPAMRTIPGMTKSMNPMPTANAVSIEQSEDLADERRRAAQRLAGVDRPAEIALGDDEDGGGGRDRS